MSAKECTNVTMSRSGVIGTLFTCHKTASQRRDREGVIVRRPYTQKFITDRHVTYRCPVCMGDSESK